MIDIIETPSGTEDEDERHFLAFLEQELPSWVKVASQWSAGQGLTMSEAEREFRVAYYLLRHLACRYNSDAVNKLVQAAFDDLFGDEAEQIEAAREAEVELADAERQSQGESR